ncbi:hypothetical protein D3C71_2146500 [compost metagenome]
MLRLKIGEGGIGRTPEAPDNNAEGHYARNADQPALARRQGDPPILQFLGHGTARIVTLAICWPSVPAIGWAVMR